MQGNTLKAFKAVRDVGDSYEDVKAKMLTWYEDMDDRRQKNAKYDFEKASFQPDECLF